MLYGPTGAFVFVWDGTAYSSVVLVSHSYFFSFLDRFNLHPSTTHQASEVSPHFLFVPPVPQAFETND